MVAEAFPPPAAAAISELGGKALFTSLNQVSLICWLIASKMRKACLMGDVNANITVELANQWAKLVRSPPTGDPEC